jgi:hypothetical protein
MISISKTKWIKKYDMPTKLKVIYFSNELKKHMKAFVGKIIQMMKDEKLFASQGGPIILAQVFFSFFLQHPFVYFNYHQSIS